MQADDPTGTRVLVLSHACRSDVQVGKGLGDPPTSAVRMQFCSCAEIRA